MIELIFLLTAGLCIPDGQAFDCTWDIIVVKDQEFMDFNLDFAGLEPGSQGFVWQKYKLIYIMFPHVWHENGCNYLWFNIMIAMQVPFDEMPVSHDPYLKYRFATPADQLDFI